GFFAVSARDSGPLHAEGSVTTGGRTRMAAAASHAPQRTRRDDQGFIPNLQKDLQEAQKEISPFLDFWTKLNNDWIFNFSGTLAYGLLTTIFPILLVIVAIGGFLLGVISTDPRAQLENAIAGALPGGGSAVGGP